MAKSRHTKGELPFLFVPIPTQVLKHPQFVSLPAAAKALLLDLLVQHNGKNNGKLCPSFEVMKRDHGWTSKSKLIRAKAALLTCPFVIQTRIGHPPRTPEWLGITWYRLAEDPTMEITNRGWPYLNFAISVVPNQDRSRPKTGRNPLKTGPMEPCKPSQSFPKQDHATEVEAEEVIGPESGDVLEVAISTAPQDVPEATDAPPSAHDADVVERGVRALRGSGMSLADRRKLIERLGARTFPDTLRLLVERCERAPAADAAALVREYAA